MKMKQMSALVIGALFASSTLAEKAEPFEPNFKEMTAISWGSPDISFRWWGIFLADGSANLNGYSDDVLLGGRLKAPQGSFSFKKIYKIIAPHLKDDYDRAKETLSIAFSYGHYPDVVIKRFYIEDKTAIRTLMYGLRDKALPWSDYSKAYLEKAFSKYPLVPGDPPTPFVYNEKAYRIAQRNALEQAEKSERENIIKRRAAQGLTLSSPKEEKRAVEAELAEWRDDDESPPAIGDSRPANRP